MYYKRQNSSIIPKDYRPHRAIYPKLCPLYSYNMLYINLLIEINLDLFYSVLKGFIKVCNKHIVTASAQAITTQLTRPKDQHNLHYMQTMACEYLSIYRLQGHLRPNTSIGAKI